jgi:hypothetical protein
VNTLRTEGGTGRMKEACHGFLVAADRQGFPRAKSALVGEPEGAMAGSGP